jgi:hypothetical protein
MSENMVQMLDSFRNVLTTKNTDTDTERELESKPLPKLTVSTYEGPTIKITTPASNFRDSKVVIVADQFMREIEKRPSSLLRISNSRSPDNTMDKNSSVSHIKLEDTNDNLRSTLGTFAD